MSWWEWGWGWTEVWGWASKEGEGPGQKKVQGVAAAEGQEGGGRRCRGWLRASSAAGPRWRTHHVVDPPGLVATSWWPPARPQPVQHVPFHRLAL